MKSKFLLPTLINQILAIYLVYLWFQHKLSYYIHPRYELLVLLSALFVLVLSSVYVLKFLLGHKSKKSINLSKIPAFPKNTFTLSELNLNFFLGLLAVVFIFIVIFLPPKPLLGFNGNINQNPVLNNSAYQATSTKSISKKEVITDLNIKEWATLIESDTSLKIYKNQKLELSGFVSSLKTQNSSQQSFQLSRYIISCCAVDASQVSLPVTVSLGQEFPSLKNNDWVKVSGYIYNGQFEGETQPVIVSTKIQTISEPEHPYLYY